MADGGTLPGCDCDGADGCRARQALYSPSCRRPSDVSGPRYLSLRYRAEGTGKNANFTAEEIASAIDVSQQGSDVLTKSALDAAVAGIDARFARVEAALGTFDAKFEALRADIKAEVKSSQVQNLIWLSGIVLASNGMVIALLARIAGAI